MTTKNVHDCGGIERCRATPVKCEMHGGPKELGEEAPSSEPQAPSGQKAETRAKKTWLDRMIEASNGKPVYADTDSMQPGTVATGSFSYLCQERDSNDVQCELAAGHVGEHACPSRMRPETRDLLQSIQCPTCSKGWADCNCPRHVDINSSYPSAMNRPSPRCQARESGDVQCELPAGHAGEHACPEALAAFEKARGLTPSEPRLDPKGRLTFQATERQGALASASAAQGSGLRAQGSPLQLDPEGRLLTTPKALCKGCGLFDCICAFYDAGRVERLAETARTRETPESRAVEYLAGEARRLAILASKLSATGPSKEVVDEMVRATGEIIVDKMIMLADQKQHHPPEGIVPIFSIDSVDPVPAGLTLFCSVTMNMRCFFQQLRMRTTLAEKFLVKSIAVGVEHSGGSSRRSYIRGEKGCFDGPWMQSDYSDGTSGFSCGCHMLAEVGVDVRVEVENISKKPVRFIAQGMGEDIPYRHHGDVYGWHPEIGSYSKKLGAK